MRCLLLWCALATLGLTACAQNGPIALVVIAPDGGDPFLGVDAATQARITLENDAGVMTLVDVGADGYFQINITPHDPNETSRLHIDALRAGQVIATGATPPTQWMSQENHLIAVLMQPRDSLVPGPVTFASGRANAQFVDLNDIIIGIFTGASQSNTAFTPDGYDLLGHGRAGGLTQQVPGEFDGDSSMLAVLSSAGATTASLLIVRGPDAVLYSGNPMVDMIAPPQAISTDRAAANVVASSVVQDPLLGGWLVGGRAPNGPSARVDHVDSGIIFSRVDDLSGARVAPQIIVLSGDSNIAGGWLIGGGNAADVALLEVYAPASTSTNHFLALGNDDYRTDATIVCAASDSSHPCSRVLVLGGRLNGALAPDDFILEVSALSSSGLIPTTHGPFLTHRRAGARAALAEGGVVVVAGGSDDAGNVTDVEFIDVSMAMPVAGHVVGQSCANPAVHAVSNGSVIIAGGMNSDGSACSNIAFFRH